MKLLYSLGDSESLILPPSWTDTFFSDEKAAIGLFSRPFFKLKCKLTAACSWSIQHWEHFPTALSGWATPRQDQSRDLLQDPLRTQWNVFPGSGLQTWPNHRVISKTLTTAFCFLFCGMRLSPQANSGLCSLQNHFLCCIIITVIVIIILLMCHLDIKRKASLFGPTGRINCLKESPQLWRHAEGSPL